MQLEPHSNRTPLSALFYSQRSDCCCIYNWPAINASSGRLAITNGSPSTESPLWSRRHWREVYLVDRIDQRVMVLYLFIYLFEERAREERGRSISTRCLSPLAYLLMIGWRRCAVADVRLFRVIWGKLLRSNWALKTNRVKHFHHWFQFSVQDKQKELSGENKRNAEDRRAPQQWPSVWNSSSSLLIRNDPPCYLLTIVSGALGSSHSKKKLIAPHRKVNTYLRRKWYYKKTGSKWDGNFWNIIDLVSKKTQSVQSGSRKESAELLCTWNMASRDDGGLRGLPSIWSLQIIKCPFPLCICISAAAALLMDWTAASAWRSRASVCRQGSWGIGPILTPTTPFTQRCSSELEASWDVCAGADVCGGGVFGREQAITTSISHPDSPGDGKWLLVGFGRWLWMKKAQSYNGFLTNLIHQLNYWSYRPYHPHPSSINIKRQFIMLEHFASM